MNLFRISWQTPSGEQTEWAHFGSADEALREANARERSAMMTDLEREMQSMACRAYMNDTAQASRYAQEALAHRPNRALRFSPESNLLNHLFGCANPFSGSR